ncbi:hypothetical protein CIB84_004491 [Bambusicola thoracicus]|uniref:Uncharacterized protein n=1 Tax=Bambusicola thoracicus TaxID=9083 RepID=A0A2P4T608_BAMTH|nr:hypothetical protein CIB84_004491 [Bambusicola thoracicus]
MAVLSVRNRVMLRMCQQIIAIFKTSHQMSSKSYHTSPILTEKEAKQILRTRREDRQRKAGFPDEPMRVIYDIYF